MSMLLFMVLTSVFLPTETFLRQQLAMPRVKSAFAEKDSSLRTLSLAKGLPYPPKALYLRAFKKEGALEVWSRVSRIDSFVLLASYPICAASGVLGPKVQMGDGQVPEGVYHIAHFNPHSSYELSLGVSYPNAVDRARSAGKQPGGDIYIHGDCVTIGCLPLTDDKIREVYVLAVQARNAGQQKIPVHIFPARLKQKEYDSLSTAHPQHAPLWSSL